MALMRIVQFREGRLQLGLLPASRFTKVQVPELLAGESTGWPPARPYPVRTRIRKRWQLRSRSPRDT